MKSNEIQLSLIIPIYNRPHEIEELLNSLTKQSRKDFEVIIVEDGSHIKCEEVVEKYKSLLDIKYYYKENTGPGLSRNFGCQKASGNYFIVLDSDCIIPPQYIAVVLERLTENYCDTFGGPDKAHESFSTLQKSINYAMTSFLTTGGIRGGGEKLDKFHPRSFNMGFSKEVFEKTGGFPSARFANVKAAGEDIELSIQIKKLGFSVKLFEKAFVYHKRRTNLKQFFKQAYNFGIARIILSKRNSGTLKAVHLLPSLFVMGMLILLLGSIFYSVLFLLPFAFLTLLIVTDASLKNKNPIIGLFSALAAYIQLIGYGLGFINAFIKYVLVNKSIGS